jgi:hypothetical protein
MLLQMRISFDSNRQAALKVFKQKTATRAEKMDRARLRMQ